MVNKFSSRIESLRSKMESDGIAAIIVVHTDPHHSEYLSTHWQVREWLSGFTGSAGNLVVTKNEALLWTDSRYFLQAEQELAGSGITLMRDGLLTTPSIEQYLIENLKEGDKVGVDLMLLSKQEANEMRKSFVPKGINLVHYNPVDELWLDRPDIPDSPVYSHDVFADEEKGIVAVSYSGESTESKIERVMMNVRSAGGDTTVICALDEIAWILNLRGTDVLNTPVFTSFLILSNKTLSTLFIKPEKIEKEHRIIKHLLDSGIRVLSDYSELIPTIESLPKNLKITYNPQTTADRIVSAIGERGIATESPAALMKACKNEKQIEGLRNALNRDSVALVNLFMEIERRVNDKERLTEMEVADLATKYRSEQALFRDNSFETIAGYKAHGAIVHYTADENSNAEIFSDGLLLVDSGAQYLDGTTDITRTVSLGNPTAEEKRDFTLVMKGHIALARAKFPAGTVGAQLDVLARQFLWTDGKSYLHGTGHGVGFFLGVHEGPQSIRLNYVPTPLLPGMVTSNEPGIYLADRYGIRCENLVLTVEDEENEFGKFYRFETLTLFPFDLSLFDTSIMTDEEIEWLNNYHARCAETILPLLNEEQAQWLKEKTKKLTR